ncbi:DNA polymerase III subunit epsilon [Corynebacterium tapiri]|uniref:DNA polymerase III subunit epsilon n=1 Tax=Corynebacterium tapiri TaxID=1448266 RepID=A0A5C4U3E2_9CORY|nr:DNA polymerase III subunit epsilon [Corynebacterium tapiri]TNL97381.1 DNA polymerase III subunit epsilon [Corynebacterium tapiri]
MNQESDFPYVALVARGSGIHPSTSRLITLDALTFDDHGSAGERIHLRFNPGTDPGPRHMHGLTHEEVAEAPRFASSLKKLDALLDDRTLVTHRTSLTWGFVVSEARKAMNAAARANRSRGRGRNRGRGRQRVGHVPRPATIVDTLATARRQGVSLSDTRIPHVAKHYGVTEQAPVDMVKDLFLEQRRRGALAECGPKELRADRCGLQRSHVRIDAVEAPRPVPNPGQYRPGSELKRGMEIVVAPEIEMDPNEVVEAIVKAELAYSEKLTRQTSLVVCNETTDLHGKAMHAQRKDIPLMSDVAFMEAVQRVEGN